MPTFTNQRTGRTITLPDHATIAVASYRRSTAYVEAGSDPAAPKVEDDRPSVRDAKADWVAYAVAQGADAEEAEACTKAELVETYGA